MALGYGRTGTNNFATAKFIVDTNGLDKGATHTTIASALTSASSGETIFIKPGTYTENLTLKAGVNLVAFDGDQTTPNVTIVGKLTASFAGTCTLSGIRLQTNSDFLLVNSGSSATVVNLNRCYINASNNTAISFTSSSASAKITLVGCRGNLGTTGIAYFSSSSSGTLLIDNCLLQNSGNSTTANTVSAGTLELKRATSFASPITTSGTSGFGMFYSRLDTSAINTTALIVGGSGTHGIDQCIIRAGSATAVTVTSTTNIHNSTVGSTNGTALIDGAGTVVISHINTDDSADNITTSTVSYTNSLTGPISFDAGTNYLNTYTESTWTPEITGSGGNPTIAYTTQSGIYTKIGNVIHAKALITINTISGGSGAAQISLPAQTASDGVNPIGTVATTNVAFPASTDYLIIHANTGVSIVTLRSIKNNTTQGEVQISDLANGDVIYFNLTYWV